MPINKLPAAFISYCATFDLVALAQQGGRLVVTHDPSGSETAWWARRQDADRLLEAARADGDVRLAAFKLQLPVTDHEVALRRVAHRLHQLDTRLDAAQGRRLMRFFNREYKRRRRAAAAIGVSFMSYPTALAGLRNALVDAIAKGQLIDGSLVERALGS